MAEYITEHNMATGEKVTREMTPSEVAALAAQRAQELEDAPVRLVPTYTIVRRIEAAGKTAEALSILDAHPVLKARFYTVGAIRVDDANAIMLITAIGLDPSVILGPGA